MTHENDAALFTKLIAQATEMKALLSTLVRFSEMWRSLKILHLFKIQLILFLNLQNTIAVSICTDGNINFDKIYRGTLNNLDTL